MATSTAKPKGKKNLQLDAAAQSALLTKVSGMTAEDLNTEFSDTQLEIQKIFANLQAEVNNKFSTAQELDQAIDLKRTKLKELHEIEDAAINLDELKAELEAQRQQITDERAEAERSNAEYEKGWKQIQERKEAEWKYDVDQKHRKFEDDWQQKMEKARRDETERTAALTKSWNEREESLKEQENELNSLRQQAGEFPAKLEAEAKRQVGAALNAQKKEHDTFVALMGKDADTEKKLNAEREAALKATITRLETQLNGMAEQVREANQKAAEVASKALDSASGRAALAAVQEQIAQTPTPQTAQRAR